MNLSILNQTEFTKNSKSYIADKLNSQFNLRTKELILISNDQIMEAIEKSHIDVWEHKNKKLNDVIQKVILKDLRKR